MSSRFGRLALHYLWPHILGIKNRIQEHLTLNASILNASIKQQEWKLGLGLFPGKWKDDGAGFPRYLQHGAAAK